MTDRGVVGVRSVVSGRAGKRGSGHRCEGLSSNREPAEMPVRMWGTSLTTVPRLCHPGRARSEAHSQRHRSADAELTPVPRRQRCRCLTGSPGVGGAVRRLDRVERVGDRSCRGVGVACSDPDLGCVLGVRQWHVDRRVGVRAVPGGCRGWWSWPVRCRPVQRCCRVRRGEHGSRQPCCCWRR